MTPEPARQVVASYILRLHNRMRFDPRADHLAESCRYQHDNFEKMVILFGDSCLTFVSEAVSCYCSGHQLEKGIEGQTAGTCAIQRPR